MTRHESRAYERGRKAFREGKVVVTFVVYRRMPPKAKNLRAYFERGFKAEALKGKS